MNLLKHNILLNNEIDEYFNQFDRINRGNTALNTFLKVSYQPHEIERLFDHLIDKDTCLKCERLVCRFKKINWRLCEQHLPHVTEHNNMTIFVNACTNKPNEIHTYENITYDRNEFYAQLKLKFNHVDIDNVQNNTELNNFVKEHLFRYFYEKAYTFNKYYSIFYKCISENKQITIGVDILRQIITDDVEDKLGEYNFKAECEMNADCKYNENDIKPYICVDKVCYLLYKTYEGNIYMLRSNNGNFRFLVQAKEMEHINNSPTPKLIKTIQGNHYNYIYDGNLIQTGGYQQLCTLKPFISNSNDVFNNIMNSNREDKGLLKIGLNRKQAAFWSQSNFIVKCYLFCISNYTLIKSILLALKPLHEQNLYHYNINQYNVFISFGYDIFIFNYEHVKQNGISEFKSHQFLNEFFHDDAIEKLMNSKYKQIVDDYFDILESIDFTQSSLELETKVLNINV